MKSTPVSHLRVSAFGMLGVAALASGCADSDPSPADSSDAPTGPAVAEFVIHVQPRAGKVSFHRLSAAAAEAQAKHVGPGLSPQAMADVNVVSDDVEGSGPANSVELVTTSVTDTFGTGAQGGCPANSLCGDVKLNSFWSRTLNNTYVEITSMTDSTGQPLSGHAATNSDAPPSTCQSGCPSNSLGLWKYQSASVDTTHFSFGSTGVVAPGAANGASRTWVFANPDDAEWYAYMRVVASTTYSNYSLGSPLTMPAYNDACTVGTGETRLNIVAANNGRTQTQPANTNSEVYVVLPFQFTFYGTNYAAGSRLNFSKWGNATFSVGAATGGAIPSTGNNSALPSTSAPRPGIFPFWDNFAWANTGSRGLCAKSVGSTPNRQVVISWKRVAASGNGNSGPYATFGMVLNEGSEEIWFDYSSGSGAWSATIGAQDANGTTAATGSTTVTTFPTANSRKVLRPLP